MNTLETHLLAKARKDYETYYDKANETFDDFLSDSYRVSLGYEDAFFDCETLVWESVGSYQGDHIVLVKGPDGRIGFEVIGYGSCSGCDALEGQDFKGTLEVLEETRTKVHWENDAQSMFNYIKDGVDREITNTYMDDEERATVWKKLEDALLTGMRAPTTWRGCDEA